MSTIYYTLAIILYAIIVISVGFYIAYIIDRHHDNLDRFQIARVSIIEDLTIITEQIDESNKLLEKYIVLRWR